MRHLRINAPILRVADISTAHLSKRERDQEWSKWPVACAGWDFGFFVYVPDAETNIKEAGLSLEEWPGLIAVSQWAAPRGIEWVKFGCDSFEILGLPEFDGNDIVREAIEIEDTIALIHNKEK